MTDRDDFALMEGTDFHVRRGHWLPKKMKVDCIAFRKTLYLRNPHGGIPNHEYMHLLQFRRHGTVGVVGHYLRHFIRNYRAYKDLGEAFRRVPFELEARDFEAQQGKYRP